MAYFAQVIDTVVTSVHVVSDAALDPDDIEGSGGRFLANLYGTDASEYVETFTDGRRGKQACIGDIWDGTDFVAPIEVSEK